ncbi:MAG: DoxX family protein [Deltaproteobacteria bacterium]|nr:DoxX family protein [Deltaproteobacteria bacterium]
MITKVKGMAENIMTSPWPYRILRFSLAAMFIYGGVMKLIDPKSFARVISSYDIVPEMLLPFVVETVAGIALLFDIRGSLAVISGLLGLFVFVLGYGILNDLNVDCGCFGAEELAQQNSLRRAFYRDLFLVGIIVPYLYMSRWIRNRAVLTVREQTRIETGDKNP